VIGVLKHTPCFGRVVQLDGVEEDVNLHSLGDNVPPDKVDLASPFCQIRVPSRSGRARIRVDTPVPLENGVSLLEGEVTILDERPQLPSINRIPAFGSGGARLV
jgi:hypothetical protein